MPSSVCDESPRTNPPYKLEYLAAGGSALVYGLNASQVLKEYFDAGKDQECRALERLYPHPNIVRWLHHAHIEGNKIVLERGRCLRTIMKQDKLPSLTDRISYARQAAVGLDYIHKKNIIHADIGLHNMILIGEQRLAIIDFEGCLIDGKCVEGEGTCYEWCSYRPFRNDEGATQVNVTTDIFAYGCALFELVTGKQPHYDLTGDPAMDDRTRLARSRWDASEFPDVTGLPFADRMMGCWQWQYHNMEDVIKALDGSISTARK